MVEGAEFESGSADTFRKLSNAFSADTFRNSNFVPALKATSWTHTAQQPMPDSHAESKAMTADAESDCRQLSSRPERPSEDAKTLAAKFGVAERGKCLVNASPFASAMRHDFVSLSHYVQTKCALRCSRTAFRIPFN